MDILLFKTLKFVIACNLFPIECCLLITIKFLGMSTHESEVISTTHESEVISTTHISSHILMSN